MKGSIARQDRLSFILYLGETSYIHTVPFTVSALYSYLFNDWALVIWFAQIFPFSNRRWHALEEQPKTNNKINKIIHKKINHERLKDKIIEEDWYVKHTEQKLAEGRQEQSDDDRIECESMVKVKVM